MERTQMRPRQPALRTKSLKAHIKISSLRSLSRFELSPPRLLSFGRQLWSCIARKWQGPHKEVLLRLLQKRREGKPRQHTSSSRLCGRARQRNSSEACVNRPTHRLPVRRHNSPLLLPLLLCQLSLETSQLCQELEQGRREAARGAAATFQRLKDSTTRGLATHRGQLGIWLELIHVVCVRAHLFPRA